MAGTITLCPRGLVAFDISSFGDKSPFEFNPETGVPYGTESAKKTTSLLIKSFLEFPHKETPEGSVEVQMPTTGVSKIRFPRHRPIPVEKPKTRWERFALEKGVQKRKRSRMVYDELSKDWVPRWGPKSIKHIQHDNRFAIEIKQNADYMIDPFAAESTERRMKKAKQEMREIRNELEGRQTAKKLKAAVKAKGSRRPPMRMSKIQ